jgi:hypothetical protein
MFWSRFLLQHRFSTSTLANLFLHSSIKDYFFSFISYSSYLFFTLILSVSLQLSLLQLDGGVYSLAMLAALNCGKHHHPVICWLYFRNDGSCWTMIAAVCGSMDMWMVRSAQWFGMGAFRYALPTSLTMTCPISLPAICAMVELKCYVRDTIAQIAGSQIRHVVVGDVGRAYQNARMVNDCAERTINMTRTPPLQQDASFCRCFLCYVADSTMLLTIQYEVCLLVYCHVTCDNHSSN